MDMNENQPKQIPFSEVINALLDNSQPFPAVMMPNLSDITEKNLADVKKVWRQVDDQRRIALMEDMEEIQDRDTLSNYSSISELALDDPLPAVRILAISMLWDWPQKQVAHRLLSMLQHDADSQVRASAASGLGNYVYLAELDEFSSDLAEQIVDTLLKVIKSDEIKLVRRRALEAVSYSCRDEIPPMIEAAYKDPDREWLISALCAMGRSNDEAWNKHVLRHMNHSIPEVQFEAIRAAGDLEIKEAREILIDILDHYQDLDEDVRIAAVVSLSKIGGTEVRSTLESLLEEIEDDDEAEIISSAIENLDFMEMGVLPGMFDLDQFNLGRGVDDDLDDEDDDDDWEEEEFED